MLSGFLNTSESMFPDLVKGIMPTPDDMEDSYRKMQLDRRVSVTGYKVAVFDMHSAKDRKRYSDLMMDLTARSGALKARITVHDRKMLPRKDGSAGWFNYLEWIEFRLDEKPISVTSGKNGDKNG